jgi:hypothetical protein
VLHGAQQPSLPCIYKIPLSKDFNLCMARLTVTPARWVKETCVRGPGSEGRGILTESSAP